MHYKTETKNSSLFFIKTHPDDTFYMDIQLILSPKVNLGNLEVVSLSGYNLNRKTRSEFIWL